MVIEVEVEVNVEAVAAAAAGRERRKRLSGFDAFGGRFGRRKREGFAGGIGN